MLTIRPTYTVISTLIPILLHLGPFVSPTSMARLVTCFISSWRRISRFKQYGENDIAVVQAELFM